MPLIGFYTIPHSKSIRVRRYLIVCLYSINNSHFLKALNDVRLGFICIINVCTFISIIASLCFFFVIAFLQHYFPLFFILFFTRKISGKIRIMKRIRKINIEESPIAQIIQHCNTSWANQYFKPSSGLNKERALMLAVNEKFSLEIKSIRREFNIPRLSPKKDVIPFNTENYTSTESCWLENNLQEKAEIDKKIHELLKKFYLPINFYDWLKYYILYKQPDWFPLYNWFDLATTDYNKLEKLPLTTGEKVFLKQLVRKRLCLEKYGKTSQKLHKAYKEFSKKLSKIKNTKRKYRNFPTYLKILQEKGKLIYDRNSWSNEECQKQIKARYKDIVPIIDENENFPENKTNQNLRKIVSRHKKMEKSRFQRNR